MHPKTLVVTLLWFTCMVHCYDDFFEISEINSGLCRLDRVVTARSKTECVFKCKRKDKAAVYKDGECFCADQECLSKNQKAIDDGKNDAIWFLRRKREEEFALEIPNPTVNVPKLPDKLLPIKNQFSFTYWFYPYSTEGGQHIFTVPINHNLQNSIIQPTISGSAIGIVFKDVARSKAYSIPKMKWIHIGTTINVAGPSLTVVWYVNGKKIGEDTSNANPTNLPNGQSYKGVVFGNDVDYAEVNDPNQSFLGRLTELYIFDSVLSEQQIHNIYYHRIPTENRILSWIEFKGTANEIDVKTIDYPYEIMDK